MSVILGLGACFFSSLCFGSMYVAVRHFETGDGIFVQWIVCASIFLVGMVVNALQNFPAFQPLAMLGGFLWTIGNATALPIIKVIGLGTGILVWGTTNCLIGWASGRFGLFGINKSVPHSPFMNYTGLIFVIIGGALFAFIKPTVKDETNSMENTECSSLMRLPLHQSSGSTNSPNGNTTQTDNNEISEEEHIDLKFRIIAIIVAGFAGLCYGSTFVPVIYIQDHPKEFPTSPKDAIAYSFSHFSGIFLTSSIIFIIYLFYKQNKPFVNGKTILPALFAGLLWALAQLAWFYANDLLSQSITFPINSMMPGVCGSLWSVFHFKEIKGVQNYRLLIIAVLITFTGAILVGISK